MKKQITFCTFFVAIIFGILANFQTMAQLSTWTLPPLMVNFKSDGAIDYKSLPQPGIGDLGYQGQQSIFSHNMMSDANGELLFFVIDGRVYDKEGYLLVGNNSFNGCAPCLPVGCSEMIIVPVPGQCKRYFIISSSQFATYNPPGLLYSILDLDLPSEINDGHWGRIDPEFENLNLTYTNGAAKCGKANISVTPEVNGRRFLVASECDYGRIFEITETGITPTSDLLDIYGIEFERWRSEHEIILRGDKFLWAYATFANGGDMSLNINLLEVNFNGDLIKETLIPVHEPIVIDVDGLFDFHGLEFSENGQFLFITYVIYNSNGSPNQNFIQYIDLTTNTTYNMPNVPTWKADEIALSQIERGINNKLYYATRTGLMALKNSNDPYSGWEFLQYPGNQIINPSTETSTTLQKIFLLPDQIDGNDYSTFPDDASCCNFMYTGGRPYYTASASGTWTAQNNPIDPGENVIYIGKELRIPTGKGIKIKNMTFKFGENARVIIEKGARLTLEGSTFTSVDCSQIMWNGVEVEGSASGEGQVKTTKHGIFEVFNSIIEHAYKGAYTLKNQGGIIRVNGSIFRNNQIGILINTFHNFTFPGNKPSKNYSYIYDSEFVTKGLLKTKDEFPDKFIELIENEGVQISGCSFKNLSPNFYTKTTRGNGIISKDATYKVLPYCPQGPLGGGKCVKVFSVFSNLDYGIHASNLISTLPITVDQAKFGENFQGIFLGGANFSAITNNTFQIKNNGWGATVDPTYGLYMYGCTKYTVENNLFHTDQIAGRTVGIFVSQSGEDYNRIYDNEFLNLFTGTMALGINGVSTNKVKGLRINCNTYTNAIYDIGLRDGDISPVQGLYNSSDLSLLAGNRFYQTWCWQDGGVNDNQFSVFNRTQQSGGGGQDIEKIEYLHAENTDHELFCYNELEINNSLIPTVVFDEATQCANSVLHKTRPKIMERIKEIEEVIKEKEKPLEEGNSPELIAALKNQNGVYNQKLHTDLIEKSPYLSGEVIRLVAIKTNIANLKRMQVLEKNLPLPSIVKEIISVETYVHLTEAQKQILLQETEVISERKHLEHIVALYKAEREININEIIRQHLNDSIVDFDSIRDVLKNYHPDYEKHLEMDIEITEGKFAKAKAIMNTIYLEDQNQNRKEVNEKTIKLKEISNGNQSNTITPEDNLTLELIAEDMTDPSYFKARNLLYHVNNIHRPEERKLPELNMDQGMAFQNTVETEENNSTDGTISLNEMNKPSISVYPNPSDGKVFIQISNSSSNEYSITVSDIIGREIKSLNAISRDCSFENLLPGVYLITITQNSVLINQSKLIVN